MMTAAEAVLWPNRWPLYTLMKHRASIGEAAFASEKQSDPVDPTLCEWPSSYFDWPGILFDRWPTDLAIKTLALDPSKGKDAKHGDYSAIVRYGRALNGVEYVEADLARRDTERIVADTIQHVIDFQPEELAVETNTFQELLLAPLQAEHQRRERELNIIIPLNVASLNNMVNKEVRIRRHGPYLSQRRVRFKARSPGTALLIQQLRDFSIGDHDDGPDGWEMARRRAIEIFNKRGKR